jgi:hypothetical protein
MEFGKNVAAPLGDVAELGARGIDWAAQKFGATPRAPQPMETTEAFRNLGLGLLEKAGVKASAGHEKYADAVGRFFADRYGGIENVRKTLAQDPVGFAADMATVLTAGGGLAARGPGLVGKVGEVAGAAGRLVDPLSVAATAVSPLARPAAELLGVSSGVGPEAIQLAGRAGLEGGEAAKAFRENIRGAVPTQDVVADAQDVVRGLRQQRSAAYVQGMQNVAGVRTPLNFNDIDQALQNITNIQTFHGQVLSPKTQAIRQEIGQEVQKWKMLNPALFHTPEGLDALKRLIGEIKDDTPWGTPQRVVADQAYNAIRQTIVKAAPEYAKTMKGYEEASNHVKDLERELSIPNPNRGNVDTALRKLQTVLRNNVNTGYGRRRELAQFLVDNGSPNLLYKLAGQQLQPIAPRGLARLGSALGAELAAMLGIGLGHTGLGLSAVPLAIAASPRAIGEAAYWAGTGYRALRPAELPLFQTGRINEAQPTSRAAGGNVPPPGGTGGRPYGERALNALRKARERKSKALSHGGTPIRYQEGGAVGRGLYRYNRPRPPWTEHEQPFTRHGEPEKPAPPAGGPYQEWERRNEPAFSGPDVDPGILRPMREPGEGMEVDPRLAGPVQKDYSRGPFDVRKPMWGVADGGAVNDDSRYDTKLPGRQEGGEVKDELPPVDEAQQAQEARERAALRTQRSVQGAQRSTEGPGRQEGPLTSFVEGGYGVPAIIRGANEEARRAFESAGELQRTGEYDPEPVVKQTIGAIGAPGLGPAVRGGVALGAGAVRRAAAAAPEMRAGLTAAERAAPLREAPYPQFAEEYPPIGPGTPTPKTNPTYEGETFLKKTLTPESKQFEKARTKIMADMKENGYTPYFDPGERSLVNPNHYPAANVDTLQLSPKRQDAIDKYMEQIGAPQTRALLRRAYKRGQQLGNAHDWYFMGQLEKEFMNELGPEAGREAFLQRFAVPMASTTSGNQPTANLLISHYLNYLRNRGMPMPTGAWETPPSVGGRFFMNNVEDYENIMGGGGYQALGAGQPKMHNFARSFVGDLSRAVMDEQMAGGMLAHAGKKSLADPARKIAYGLLEKPVHQEAARLGIEPGAFQDVAWAGFKNEPGKPMIEHVNDAIERTHRLTGMPRDEIVSRALIRGEIPLYTTGAMPLPSLPSEQEKTAGLGPP